jgi:uncharacterized protein (DUF2267 family)
MKFDEFIGRVHTLAGLSSTEDALRATRSVLGVLSERLVRGEAEDLAAQLPKEFAEYMRPPQSAQRFGVSEFFEKVSRREGVDADIAEKHTRAVLSVVTAAVTSGEIKDVLSELPKEYHELFTPEPVESTMPRR